MKQRRGVRWEMAVAVFCVQCASSPDCEDYEVTGTLRSTGSDSPAPSETPRFFAHHPKSPKSFVIGSDGTITIDYVDMGVTFHETWQVKK